MAPRTNRTYPNRKRLASVEWIDASGRICCAQFWSWTEAIRFAASVSTLVTLQPF